MAAATTSAAGQGVFYYWGDDTWAARQALDVLAQEAAARIRFIDRDDLERDHAVLGAGASLFGRVLMVVRDAGTLPAALQRAVAAALSQPGVFCVLWDRGKLDRRGVLFRQFGRAAQEFAVPAERELAGWVLAEAQQRGVQITPHEARQLIEHTSGDRWRIGQELDRAAALGELAIEHYGADGGEDVFAVLAALVRGQRTAALHGVQALLAAGHGEFYLLSMLAYQFRTLLVVRSGLDAGLPPFGIVREGQVKSFAVQKNLPVARQREAAVWQEALTRVLATDTAIRGGRVEPRTGLLMLVAGLAG